MRKHADRLPALHQQRLVIPQTAERGHDAFVTFPVPGSLSATTVDDQLIRPLRHGGIQVVHQHPKGGLLVPTRQDRDDPLGAVI